MTERQEKIISYVDDLRKVLPRGTINYYGRINEYYKQSFKELNKIDDISISDKIVVAQILGDGEAVFYLKKQFKPTENQLNKYKKLYERNIDIDKTINPDFLDDRYDFLEKRRDILSTDIGVQQQIVGLSDERLKILELLFNKLEQETKYSIPYIQNVLNMLSDYRFDMCVQRFNDVSEKYGGVIEDLSRMIKSGKEITDQDLTNLLFLAQSVGVKFNIDNVQELRELSHFRDEDKEDLLETLQQEEKKENPDIDLIKSCAIINIYGLHPKIAEDILKSYDFDGIEIDENNQDLYEIYSAIKNIIHEDNPKVLIKTLKDAMPYLNLSNNYAKVCKLNHELRAMFAREYNNKIYSPHGKPHKFVGDVPVYYVDDAFKMMVTSIGAYQVGMKVKNYYDYWNNPKILSHMNCCSLIANNNLSMADVKRTIFGFSNFDENMLLLSGVKDLNSTPISKYMYFDVIGKSIRYMNPDKMIDNTRGDYNEIVYERRDLSESAQNYKKQPDYIVLIEEYINPDMYLDRYEDLYAQGIDYETYPEIKRQIEQQEQLRYEAFKAAKDLDIPVVIINREKCLRNQHANITSMMKLFEENHNPELIHRVITEYENARASLGSDHQLLQDIYFNDKFMDEILTKIISEIETYPKSSRNRIMLKRELYNALKNEHNKRKAIVDTVATHRGQTTSINYKKMKEQLEML